jgi:hypothetical protein
VPVLAAPIHNKGQRLAPSSNFILSLPSTFSQQTSVSETTTSFSGHNSSELVPFVSEGFQIREPPNAHLAWLGCCTSRPPNPLLTERGAVPKSRAKTRVQGFRVPEIQTGPFQSRYNTIKEIEMRFSNSQIRLHANCCFQFHPAGVRTIMSFKIPPQKPWGRRRLSERRRDYSVAPRLSSSFP